MGPGPKTDGGGTRTLYEQLTRIDYETGTVVGIRFDRLATVVIGIFATAWGSSMASLVSGIWSAFVIKPLEGVARFVDKLTSTVTSGIESIGSGVWAPAIELVRAFGPAAWLVAVVLVLVIAYGAHKGWSLRG